MLKSLAATVALGAMTTAADAAIVNITTTADVVSIGETFEVSVAYSSETDEEFLVDAIFTFLFDDVLFDFVSASFVDDTTGVNQLDLPGDPDEFGRAPLVVDRESSLFIAASRRNSPAFLQENQADEFSFVTLTFEAVRSGTGDRGLLAFAEFLVATDPLLPNRMFADVLTGSVTVEVIPLPGAAVFLLTGIAALVARRRMAA